MRRALILFAVLALSACNGAQPADDGGAPTDGRRPAAAAAADIQGETVTYEAGGVTLKGYLAWDANAGGQRPGVLVVHEWWGQNAYARKRATMLAELGYTALALDMYGDGKTADNPQDAGALAGAVRGDPATAQVRFEAARDLLSQHPSTDPTKIAAIG